MLQTIRELHAAIVAFEKTVAKVKAETLTRQELLDTTRTLIDSYFRVGRDAVLACGVSEKEIGGLDGLMQTLLDCTYKRTRTSVVRGLLRAASKQLVYVEKQALTLSVPPRSSSLEPIDIQIVFTLRQIVPSAALSYEQGLVDLRGAERKSWRGPATDLREALRETLDHLAPDKDVMKQQNFKLETGRSEPTMKQKVRYVLKQRGKSSTAVESSEAAVEAVEAALATFVRSTYSRSTVSTHTPTDRTEVLRVRDFVRISLCELLEVRGS
jgi:hypothetical protein